MNKRVIFLYILFFLILTFSLFYFNNFVRVIRGFFPYSKYPYEYLDQIHTIGNLIAYSFSIISIVFLVQIIKNKKVYGNIIFIFSVLLLVYLFLWTFVFYVKTTIGGLILS